MYLNLGRNKKGSRKAPDPPTKTQGDLILEDPRPFNPQSPYAFFYPEHVSVTISPVSALHDAAHSPEFAERCEFRKRKKQFFGSEAGRFGGFKLHPNLVTVDKAFMQNVSDSGMLSKQAFTKSLVSMNVADVDLIGRTFELFDARKTGLVDYQEVADILRQLVHSVGHCQFGSIVISFSLFFFLVQRQQVMSLA